MNPQWTLALSTLLGSLWRLALLLGHLGIELPQKQFGILKYSVIHIVEYIYNLYSI